MDPLRDLRKARQLLAKALLHSTTPRQRRFIWREIEAINRDLGLPQRPIPQTTKALGLNQCH